MARKAGFGLVAGVDEAGRGPLAGPVVAAAVIIPEGVALTGVRDSKQMHPRAREDAFSLISGAAVSIGIGVVSNRFIDEFDILRASLEAMRQAVSFLDPRPDFVLVDGIQAIPISLPQKCLKKGDQLSLSISAASIIAKVYRDRIMNAFHDRFPAYGFRTNKGYGTPGHLDAIRRYGPAPIHRKTFKGVC
ncbi:MAG: ribonuclease HII [Deltaproteobacteria bacterium]|nr:ribonuclease HII [Deltaproteobacteria bacterium]